MKKVGTNVDGKVNKSSLIVPGQTRRRRGPVWRVKIKTGFQYAKTIKNEDNEFLLYKTTDEMDKTNG